MPKLNAKQIRGSEKIKNSKGTMNPPVVARGHKLDEALENPRAYLGGISSDDSLRDGHRVVADTKAMDPFDTERNPKGGIEEKRVSEDNG